ncbi:MAG TPA: DinB family protein [Burkholderiaceae bacterium]|nr:DinB family protein [Burkholderiaceae bacterium]
MGRLGVSHVHDESTRQVPHDPAQMAEQIDFAFTDGAPGRMSREEMLMHVITHGVGHRGQVSALMLLNSLPPATEGFTTYLHKAEASTRRRAGA